MSRQRQVSVAELQRAWRAIQAGAFQNPPPYAAGPGLAASLRPAGGRLIPVLGCGGGVGASTTSLALALAVDGPCRLVDAAAPPVSGLAGASTAELGAHTPGWSRGTRDQVVIDRPTGTLGAPAEIPAPPPGDRDDAATIVDLARPPETLLEAPSWQQDVALGGDPLVLVTSATLPGLRRLESTLTLLAAHCDTIRVVAVVLGPRRSRWPGPVRHGLGPRAAGLERAGRVVTFPADRRLAVTGLDTSPLPAPLLTAAATVLHLLAATRQEPDPVKEGTRG